jgi:hypothetical protein
MMCDVGFPASQTVARPLAWPARRSLVIAASIAPFVLAPWLSRRAADHLAHRLAVHLVELAAALRSASAPPADSTPEGAPAAADQEAEAPAAAPAPPSRTAPARAHPHRSDLLFFGRDAVARAIPPKARPRGVAKGRTDDHPAGIVITHPGVLSSVRAGDVIIEAEGVPLSSFDELVSVVSRAYEARARTIRGKVWRGGRVLTVVVEPPW